jgi:hypothetical protein
VGGQRDHLVLHGEAEGWRSQTVDSDPAVPQVVSSKPIGPVVPGEQLVVKLQIETRNIGVGEDGVVMESVGGAHDLPVMAAERCQRFAVIRPREDDVDVSHGAQSRRRISH